MNKIGLIVSREYNVRVKKKSFIVVTLLMPLFIIGMMIAPSLILTHGSSNVKHIVVVDDSEGQVVGKALASGENIEYNLQHGISKSQACIEFNDESKAAAILYIGSNILNNPSDLQLFTNESSSIATEETIKNDISRILSHEKILSYNIDNIEQILSESDIHISSIQTLKNNGSGNDQSMEETSSGTSSALSLVLGMLLYMIIIIYGQMVLATVIEEKGSRVMDVLITSCKPFDIMMGKIIGIACVAATQIAIWALLILFAAKIAIPSLSSSGVIDSNIQNSAIFTTFADIGYITKLFSLMLIYMVGGFLLYASMFAAAGSAVDTAQDASQFSTIIMMPVILSIIIMMQVINDPNSPSIIWFSIIPFTSPIIMMARLPFDVPTWQIITSVVILYCSFIVMTWISAKIYKVGIMIHGKKPSWKDFGRWIMEK